MCANSFPARHPSSAAHRLFSSAIVALVLALTTILSIDAAQAEPATDVADPYQPGLLLANTGGTGEKQLAKYEVSDGQVKKIGSVPLTASYGDIAISADGTTLYAIRSKNSLTTPHLVTLDPQTGKELTDRYITGLPAVFDANSLTVLPDGDLLMGTSAAIRNERISELYRINPQTAQATRFEVDLAKDYASAGDFLTISDHEILALTIHKDEYPKDKENRTGTMLLLDLATKQVRILGQIPYSYGAAQVGNSIYVVGALGSIYRIGAIPPEGASISYEKVVNDSLPYYGATSTEDSGVVSSISLKKAIEGQDSPHHPGDAITFTFDVQNTGNTPVTGVTVSEIEFTGTGSLSGITPESVASLQPGQVAHFAADYVVTDQDLEAGTVTNTAQGVAADRDGNELSSTPSTVIVPISAAPAGPGKPSEEPAEHPSPEPGHGPEITEQSEPPQKPGSSRPSASPVVKAPHSKPAHSGAGLARTGAPASVMGAAAVSLILAGTWMRRQRISR